jgi:hypothetical protein
MIHTINYFITRVFDVILYPFSFISPFWGILFLSILMSFVVLYIYKWVSSPRAVKAAKNKIKADILAIRIYKDLWKTIVGSFFKSLGHTFQYFGLNFLPLLIILPILFPVFVQMDIRYGMRPFHVGEEIIIQASFSRNPNDLDVELLESDYFKPKMKPVFINAYRVYEESGEKKGRIREVNWKLEVVRTGMAKIRIKVRDKIYEKQLAIGSFASTGGAALSNKKMNKTSLEHFIYPAEKLLPNPGDLENIYIRYPAGEVSFAGITTHWLVFNLILVIIIVLALKNRFGIEF